MEGYVNQFVGDGDSDDSFLIQQKHSSRKRQDNINIIINNNNKENVPKGEKSTFVPKPPPFMKDSSNLYCARALQPTKRLSITNQRNLNKTAPIFQELTCDCCQDISDKKKAVPKSKISTTSRAVVADDSSDDEDEDVVSAIVLSDSSTIDSMEDSLAEQMKKPTSSRDTTTTQTNPRKSAEDKRLEWKKKFLPQDDSDEERSYVVPSTDDDDASHSSRQKEEERLSLKENLKPTTFISPIHSKANIPREVMVDKSFDSNLDTDEDCQMDTSKDVIPDKATIAKTNASKKMDIDIDIIDLIDSDASSYSGSDNSFLDQKPKPAPKRMGIESTKKAKLSYRSKIQAHSSRLWNKSFDDSSSDDSDLDLCSPPQQRRRIRQTGNGKINLEKATPSRRPVIVDSSSDEEDQDWGIATNRGRQRAGGLADLMKQVDLNDRNIPKKKKVTTDSKRYGSKIYDDDSSLEALKSMEEDSSLEDTRHNTMGGSTTNKKKPKSSKRNSRPKPSSSKLFNTKPIARVQAKTSDKYFKSNRETLAKDLFNDYDRRAFGGKLASVELVWSNKLQKTAGLTRLISKSTFDKVERIAKIELATKIIDDMERLKSTLLHEMCHAAQWLVDGVAKPAHGKCFQKWSKIAMSKVPGVVVTVTHTYEITYKYAWACTSEGCNVVIKRQSKSVDVNKQCCGKCKGRLVEIEAPKKGSKSGSGAASVSMGLTPKKAKPPSAYNLFVKEHSKGVRERLVAERKATGNPLRISQAEVLTECGRLWNEHKKTKSKAGS